MAWKWGPENMLWQVVNNLPQLLDATYAKQWYAQSSVNGWQNGSVAGKIAAVSLDCVGGYVTAWTGSPASAAQAWWSIGWSLATGAISKSGRISIEAAKALTQTSTFISAFSGLYAATDSLTGGNQVTLLDGTLKIAGLGIGSLSNDANRLVKSLTKVKLTDTNGQLMFGYADPAIAQSIAFWSKTANRFEIIGDGISKISDGKGIIEATEMSFRQAITNAGKTKVGGILFENCDADFTEVGEINGAYWDYQTGSLVLVGKGNNPLGLLGMDRDHLLVALRASLAGQPMGVSIDPPSEYRDGIKRGVTPPDGTPMLVSYLGNTEHSLFGAIMFESDRLLKCLTNGVHNETKTPVRANVPGFKSLLEMTASQTNKNVWHRFWFVIEKVELKHDVSSNAIAFGNVKLKVLNETELDGHPKKGYVDAASEAFTSHLTEHYDEYAKQFPILARLKDLAKIAAVAKFLANKNIPLDVRSLFTTPPEHVETPSTTPGIRVVSPNVRHEGNVMHTISLFGGVDMDADPLIIRDDGAARNLKNIAEAERPSKGTASWAFKKDGVTQKATAIKVGFPSKPFKKICDDHEFFPFEVNKLLRLRRVYDSSSGEKGDLGYGWSVWIPFFITVLSPSGKHPDVLTKQETIRKPNAPVLVLHDNSSCKSTLYRSSQSQSAKDQGMFYEVTSQTVTKGKISFKGDPYSYLSIRDEEFVLQRNDCQYYFAPSGHLVRIYKNNRCLIRYHYHKGHLVRIENDLGYAYDIKYNHEYEQITNIVTNDGQHIHYSYDELGYLVSCTSDGKTECYVYDLQGRLTEIKNHLGIVTSRNIYDELGNVVTEANDVALTSSGKKIWRSFCKGRLVFAKDETGSTLKINYGEKNELSSLVINGRSGRIWQLFYDHKGKLTSLQNPSGQVTKLSYGQLGEVVQMLGQNGITCSFKKDEDHQFVTASDKNNQEWTAKYDNVGYLRNVFGPKGEQWDYQYMGDLLLRIHGPAGGVQVSPRKNTLTVRAFSKNGLWHKNVFNRNLQLIQHKQKGIKSVQFQYDNSGNISSISSEAGTLHYQVEDKDLAVTVAF